MKLNSLTLLGLAAAICVNAQSTSELTVVPPQNDATTGRVAFRELYQNGKNYVGLKAPTALTNNIELTLPASLPTTANACIGLNTDGRMVARSCAVGTVATDYSWSQTPPDNLSTPGTKTITLTPVPFGVNATDTKNWMYISGGTGTPEAVQFTGNGTAVSGAATGTVEVVTANAHTGAWTASNAGIREAVNMTPSGGSLLIPPGIIDVYATSIIDKSITVYGGSRIGVGGGSSIRSHCEDCAALDIDTPLPVTLTNFGLISAVTQSAGSGVHIYSSIGTHNCSSIVKELTIYNFYDLIHAEEGCKPQILGNELEAPARYGIFLENTYLGDAGDQFIEGNTITGNLGGTVAIYITSGGGTKITNNKILGWPRAIEVNSIGNANTSILIIADNSLDQITENGITLGGTRSWIYSTITGNILTITGSPSTCYALSGNVQGVSLTNNICANSTTVISANTSNEPVWYFGNAANNTSTFRAGTAQLTIDAPASTAQANLGTPKPGSVTYCNNCTHDGNSGGAGAFMFSVNGATSYVGNRKLITQGGNSLNTNMTVGTVDNFDIVVVRNGINAAYFENGIFSSVGAVRSLVSPVDLRLQADLFATSGAVGTASNHDVVLMRNLTNFWRLRSTGTLEAEGLYTIKPQRVDTLTNCSSSAAPAVCGSAAAGSVVVAAGSTAVTVNTSAITANSQVILTEDSSLGTKLGVTCNTNQATNTVTARTAATSFTITTSAAPVTNPRCFSYVVIN